jgi:hypothetical protein
VGQRREPDPLGSEAGEWNPYVSSNPPFDPLDPTGTGAFKEMGDIGDIRGSCVWNSMPVPCSVAMGEVNRGAADISRDEADSMTLAQMGAVFIPDFNDSSQDHADGDTTVGVILGRYEFTGAGTLTTAIAPQNDGRARLTAEQLYVYERVRKNAYNLAKNPLDGLNPCSHFLNRSGVPFTDVLKALQFQKPYDGPRSTISRRNAGLAPAGNPAENETASTIFQGERNTAATAIYKERTRYDVYLNLFNYDETTLIHEALHSATKMNDVQLAELLTGKDFSSDFFKSEEAGKAIQQTLKKHGCVMKYRSR